MILLNQCVIAGTSDHSLIVLSSLASFKSFLLILLLPPNHSFSLDPLPLFIYYPAKVFFFFLVFLLVASSFAKPHEPYAIHQVSTPEPHFLSSSLVSKSPIFIWYRTAQNDLFLSLPSI